MDQTGFGVRKGTVHTFVTRKDHQTQVPNLFKQGSKPGEGRRSISNGCGTHSGGMEQVQCGRTPLQNSSDGTCIFVLAQPTLQIVAPYHTRSRNTSLQSSVLLRLRALSLGHVCVAKPASIGHTCAPAILYTLIA